MSSLHRIDTAHNGSMCQCKGSVRDVQVHELSLLYISYSDNILYISECNIAVSAIPLNPRIILNVPDAYTEGPQTTVSILPLQSFIFHYGVYKIAKMSGIFGAKIT